MNYSPESAFLSKEEIIALQEQKLQETIAYLNQYSPFYKEFFSKARFNPSGIKTMEDLSVIPVTIKEDLQQRNDDFYAYPAIRLLNTVLHPVLWAIRSPSCLLKMTWHV